MKFPKVTPFAAALIAFAFSASPALAAAPIPIYANDLASTAARSEIVTSEGQQCRRGGSEAALKVRLGERTRACSFRPPVVGRDLEISVAARLLSGTPSKLRPRVYLSAALRSGDGGAIKVLVFPMQRKVQLIEENPDGGRRYLAIAKQVGAIRQLNRANRIYLRAFNQGPPGVCRVVVRVNGRRIAVEDLERCAQLPGRDTGFGVGATRGGEGAIASFSKLRIGVPNPF